jgi:hypothetical protein
LVAIEGFLRWCWCQLHVDRLGALIARENPDLNRALMPYVIEVMADRLNFASKAMGVLHR